MSSTAPHRLLVVANETVGGQPLFAAVKKRADEGPLTVTVVCPANAPKHGNVIYEDSVVESARNRLELALGELREAGVDATGEVGDGDPYSAAMDALDHHGADEIIVSTLPETKSGWLRRNLPDRLRDDSGLPVEHVTVDVNPEAEDGTTNVLVVANQTMGGPELTARLEEKATEGRHCFIVICPQDEGSDHARERLEEALEALHSAGLEAVGQVSDPDPFNAVHNALDRYTVDEIVVSTLPETRSGWLRRDLVGRLRSSTGKPVEHVEGGEEGSDGAPGSASKEARS